MSKTKELQRLIRHYKDETGETLVDMKKVALFGMGMGWKMPMPERPEDILAKRLAKAARQEILHDKDTGRPYRKNHAMSVKQGNETLHLWIDIDEASRPQIHKSMTLRREQMVGDGLQLSYDADHWNAANPDQEPINLEFDFTFDIDLRKNAADADEEAA